jgi:antitoxin component HigA of HigAB toxin-antitoxin module
VSEILSGRKGFGLPQIKRLHARFSIPADALIGDPQGAAG